MLETVSGITFYSAPNLENTEGVTHAFLGRTGGVSKDHLCSLNLGRREEDSPGNLAENRKRVADAFGLNGELTFTVSQVHGDRVYILDDLNKAPEDVKPVEADSIVTNIRGVTIGVLTADCVPVLLFDPVKSVTAAVHAGWKGTALNISSKAVREMIDKFGSRPEDIIAAIGPSIGQCCYRVGDDVAAAVGHRGRAAKAMDSGWMLDLPKANLIQLQEAGVRDIEVSGICTCCRRDIFFSHRGENGKTGRQLSLIHLSP